MTNKILKRLPKNNHCGSGARIIVKLRLQWNMRFVDANQSRAHEQRRKAIPLYFTSTPDVKSDPNRPDHRNYISTQQEHSTKTIPLMSGFEHPLESSSKTQITGHLWSIRPFSIKWQAFGTGLCRKRMAYS
ncbi:hypothetical protein CEXT_468211 [Caerostris extrusa]|uniref:Uncharacterized protein n=1 Tax=Caerostris extrusa TaxID=172846 RepID=A0AAV4R542_CAEEX|nr:hypothetical protein CEXT_468211 [Caerostris extrusa]